MTIERRKRTRASFEATVILKVNDQDVITEAICKDISLKGLFVHTPVKLPIGTACTIELLLYGTSSRLSLTINGTVVRHAPEGLGISFDSMDIDSYTHLKNIVMYNVPDADLIEKEIVS